METPTEGLDFSCGNGPMQILLPRAFWNAESRMTTTVSSQDSWRWHNDSLALHSFGKLFSQIYPWTANCQYQIETWVHIQRRDCIRLHHGDHHADIATHIALISSFILGLRIKLAQGRICSQTLTDFPWYVPKQCSQVKHGSLRQPHRHERSVMKACIFTQ